MTDSDLLTRINEKLELVTFLEVESDTFQLAGNCAPWILSFCPQLSRNEQVVLKDAFVFLENFIEQSRVYFWTTNSQSLSSGPWSERDDDGVEQNLSATALMLDGRLAIQMRHVPSEQLYHRRIFQKAREYSLEYERLQHEKERKEVLLFAVVHDLSGPLTSISGIIEVLSQLDLSDAERKGLFDSALEQTKTTHEMIRSILEVFDEEDHRFDPASLDAQTAPSLNSIIESVVASFDSAFSQQGVNLRLNNRLTGDDKVIAEGEQLKRVFINLLENALRYSPVSSKVTITLECRDSDILIRIADQGPGVPGELIADLFQRFVGGRKYGGKAGFGLYFCQMCVKKWGGKMDYLANGNINPESDAPSVVEVMEQTGNMKGTCFQVTLLRYPQ